jgi:hypothetical protein
MPEINNNINLVSNAVNIDLIGKYLVNGLTVTSNDPNIISRDKNGVVEVEQNNPLIIEPTTYRISNKSILKVVNTQFTYFNFPATVNVTNLNLPEIDFELPELDLIYSRYKPTSNQSVSANGLTFNPRGIELSEVVEGTAQRKQNAYFVSKEIKESGKDLRIRAKIKHKFQTNDSNYPWGVFKAWIAQGGPNISFEGQGGGRTKFGPFYGVEYISTPEFNPNLIPSVITAAEELAIAVFNFTNSQSPNIFYSDSVAYTNYLAASTEAQLVLNSLPDNVNELTLIPASTKILINNLISTCNSNDDFSNVLISSKRQAVENELNLYNTYEVDIQQSTDSAGLIKGDIGEQQTLYVDFIVPNSNFEAGDYFTITADSDSEQNPFVETSGVFRYHSIIADETYFVVTDASKNVDVWNKEL